MKWTWETYPLSVAGDYETEEISGFLLPAIRGDNVMIPYVSGRTYVPKYFDQLKITLGITFMGTSEVDTYSNILTMLAYFDTLTQGTLEVDVPTGDTLTCEAEVIDFQGPVWDGPCAAKATVTFLVAAGEMTVVPT
jgi:hypothetical protein